MSVLNSRFIDFDTLKPKFELLIRPMTVDKMVQPIDFQIKL